MSKIYPVTRLASNEIEFDDTTILTSDTVRYLNYMVAQSKAELRRSMVDLRDGKPHEIFADLYLLKAKNHNVFPNNFNVLITKEQKKEVISGVIKMFNSKEPLFESTNKKDADGSIGQFLGCKLFVDGEF